MTSIKKNLYPNSTIQDIWNSLANFANNNKIIWYGFPLWVVPTSVLLVIWYIISLFDDIFDYIGFKIVDLMIWSSEKVIEADQLKKKV